jgi:hypothetical protein
MLKEWLGRIREVAAFRGPHVRFWKRSFAGSNDYWVRRYRNGRNSGTGSYGRLAQFKARVLNEFVRAHHVQSVIEFGCGDGHQLSLADYPAYTGLDISPHALERCRRRFAHDTTRRFLTLADYNGQTAELALSLDVVYHLVEDAVFEEYLRRLFAAATRFVVVYASNHGENPPGQGPHVRHRRFTDWVAAHEAEWQLLEHIPNEYPYAPGEPETSFADFYIFRRATVVPVEMSGGRPPQGNR